MAATDLYQDLPKLARVKLPSGTEYALIDYNGRELVAPIFNTSTNYSVGDLVVYNDELYKFNQSHTAGAWNANHADLTSVADELDDIRNLIAGGIHYRGRTTSSIYDGSNQQLIVINGVSYTAQQGDLVILDVTTSGVATAYAANTDIDAHKYYKNPAVYSSYYFSTYAYDASLNTKWSDVENTMDLIYSPDGRLGGRGNKDLEFIWDGSCWNSFGSAMGFGDLAFKDSAWGGYTKPTGSGSVTVKEYGFTTKKLATNAVLGVGSSQTVSKVTFGTAINVASAGTAVRYGTANVAATAKTVATKSSTTHVYGTADVGTAIGVGTALGGTTVFNTDAIKSASLTGTKTFNTNAIKSAAISGTDGATAAKTAHLVSVDGDCLQFATAGTTTLSVTTEAASTGTVGISTTPAATAQVTLTTSNITPATAAATNRVFYDMGTTTIYEAVESPNTQTVVPAVANGTIQPVIATDYTVAVAATAATKVATGELVDSDYFGASLIATASESSVVKDVDVGTTSGTVNVR